MEGFTDVRCKKNCGLVVGGEGSRFTHTHTPVVWEKTTKNRSSSEVLNLSFGNFRNPTKKGDGHGIKMSVNKSFVVLKLDQC